MLMKLLQILVVSLALTNTSAWAGDKKAPAKPQPPASAASSASAESFCKQDAYWGCPACSITCPVGKAAVCKPSIPDRVGGCQTPPSCTCQ